MTTDDTPLVSIVIPVYNGSNYLGQAIDCALEQTYPKIEIIVVNDGSNDGGATEKIALSYGKKIRYFKKDNGGVSSALNLAIEKMKGDHFSWLSHDDLYTPDKIQIQIDALRSSRADNLLVYSDFQKINSEGRPIESGTHITYGDPVEAIFATVIHGCSLLIPAQCFVKVGKFNPDAGTTSDNELWLRIALAGFPFLKIPKALVLSREHPDRTSWRIQKRHRRTVRQWYLWAVQFIGPAKRKECRGSLPRILLIRDQFKAFVRFVALIRQDEGPITAMRLFFANSPLLLIQLARRTMFVVLNRIGMR